MLAVDVSKYTGVVTPDVVAQWRAAGVGLVIIQAHPAGYGQERSIELARVVEASGMPWDAYVYEYMGYPDWQQGALATLDLIVAQGPVPREVWLDVEDVDSEKGWSAERRVAAIRRDLALCDVWCGTHGLPRTGIYTALWYWPPKTGNTTEFSDRELWDADYDNVPDTESGFTPYGGWTSRRIKQYAGSSTLVVGGVDLDVLSVEEEAEVNGEDMEPVPQEYKDKFGEDVTWQGVADNLEGIIHMLQEQLSNADPAAAEKLSRIREIVEA